MEYVAEVIRGWPNDGAIERVETIKATTAISGGGAGLKNGDVVIKQSDGTVDLVSTSAVGNAGLVIRGDADSASVAASGNKAVVLWGNYIVRVSNYNKTSPSPAWAPGVLVTAGGTNAAGKFDTSSATTNVTMGIVLDVVAASATTTANVVIAVR